MKEAGAESLSFQLLNRNVDQPLKYVVTCLIDEWSKIRLHLTQRVVPDGPPWFDAMCSGNFDVVPEANGHGLATRHDAHGEFGGSSIVWAIERDGS